MRIAPQGPGGDSHIKDTGMLVVSLWGVNCRFGLTWGVWDGKSLFLPIQVSLRTVHKKFTKICLDTMGAV